jgi:hypothetical protein
MNLISDVEKQVRARLAELEPLVKEHAELTRVLEMFEAARDDVATQGTRTTSRPRARTPARATSRRRQPRAEQALGLVHERPGITVAELADEMGIGTTYLYRVMPDLEREGKVAKSGKGYRPSKASR